MKWLRQSQDGFSAIEMLVTILIIGLVFSTAVTSFNTFNSISTKSRQISTANTAAYSKLQDYENRSFANIPSPGAGGSFAQVENFGSSIPTFLPSPRTGTVQVRSVSSSLKQVVVTLTYGQDSNRRTFEYSTYIQQTGVGR